MLAHAFEVELDRLADQFFDFIESCGGDPRPGRSGA